MHAVQQFQFACLAALAIMFGEAAAQSDPYQRPLRTMRTQDIDVEHYRIALTLEPQARAFEGETLVRFKSLKSSLREVRLDAETFTVLRVADKSGAPLTFRHDKGVLSITLKRPLPKGATSEVAVFYSARDQKVDAAAFGFNPGADLGMVFQDAKDRRPLMVNTQSFPEGARHWFPGFDHPGDRATQETIITVPDGFQAISNGVLVSETQNPGDKSRTFHWSQTLSHPTYLFMVAAGPYVGVDSGATAPSMKYWVYPADAEIAPVAFGATPKIVAAFEEIYGAPFPWPRYDQVIVPGITGGAESTTATIIGEINMYDPAAYRDFNIDWLIAHEAAHQYWGDLVSYRDWRNMWIAESFATLSEFLWEEHANGADAAALRLQQRRSEYLRDAREKYIRPIVFDRWSYPNDLFDRHSYQKGGAVLMMLRDYVGAAKFREILQTFLTNHAYQAVTTEDFFATAEAVAGEDLDWFFEQWLLRPGHPKLEVSHTWSEGEKHVELIVRQMQDVSGDVPIFRFPVKIAIATDQGEKIFEQWIDDQEEKFSLAVDGEPKMVLFDVGDRVLKEVTHPVSIEEQIYRLAHTDAIGRGSSATSLCRQRAHKSARAALRAAAAKDAHWSVRKSALCSDAAPALQSDLAFIRNIALKDESSFVRAAAFDALRGMADRKTIKAAERALTDDQSYLVKAAAVKVLGATGDARWRPVIEAAGAQSSPRDILRKAAIEALAPPKDGAATQ
jgi:aminopeptidase N